MSAGSRDQPLVEEADRRSSRPSPSMSIAPRKCLTLLEGLPGTAAPVGADRPHRVLGLDGRRPAPRALRRRLRPAAAALPLRRWISGEITCGITSPARVTTTSSPSRTSLRARSSSLWRVAVETVTPPTWTGSSIANGKQAPGAPDVPDDPVELRGRGDRRELPGDRPARLAAGDAELAPQGSLVDLDHHAVDLEVELLAPLLPPARSARRPRRRSRAPRSRR